VSPAHQSRVFAHSGARRWDTKKPTSTRLSTEHSAPCEERRINVKNAHMLNLAKQIFGSVNDRKVRQLRPLVARINALEPTFEARSDEALRNQTSEYRHKLARGAKLDDILPEAFATVREAANRTLGQRHYDVQLMGGIFLHQGKIDATRT